MKHKYIDKIRISEFIYIKIILIIWNIININNKNVGVMVYNHLFYFSIKLFFLFPKTYHYTRNYSNPVLI